MNWNSKGLSKSVLAISSSSHWGHVILERKKSGSDPGVCFTISGQDCIYGCNFSVFAICT
jgi:hypothetical protein